MEKPGKKEDEATEISKGREEENHGAEGKTESPLDKYMKIILEARKNKQTESPFIETCSYQDEKDLSVKEDNSIEVYAPKDGGDDDDDDDDFW